MSSRVTTSPPMGRNRCPPRPAPVGDACRSSRPSSCLSWWPARSPSPTRSAASQLLRRLGPDFPPLSGVGDEAFVRNRDVFLRVSNLVVAIVVYPRAFSTEAQVRAFASDLAVRLRDG